MSIQDIEAGEELVDCYLDLTLEGRITTQQRRRVLRAGYGFWCECSACAQSEDDLRREDELRLEAFELSKRVTLDCLPAVKSSHQLNDLLMKASRLLEIRQHFHFKLVHQLETLDVYFHMMMLSDNIDKVGMCKEK